MDSTTSLSGSVLQNATKKQITKFEQAEYVHRQLLYNLMSSIYEFILTSQAPKNSDKVATDGSQTSETHTTTDDYRQIPNIETLLIHIHSCLEQIFLNGLRIFKPDVSIQAFVALCHFLRSIASSDLHLNS